MKLLTKEIATKLANPNLTGQNAQVPVCKFFNPAGAATWLIFARDTGEYSDVLWCLADLGMGCVEYGTVSLSELEQTRLPFGLTIERDIHWSPKTHANGELWKLSDYLELDTLSGI